MSKAILIAVSDGFGGYGDFLFALKLAQQLKGKYLYFGQEPPPIYIISQATGCAKIRQLKGDVEFNTPVLTPQELKESIRSKTINVGHIIEAPVFSAQFIESIDNVLSVTPQKIPLTMIPEYGFNSNEQRTAIKEYENYRLYNLDNIQYENTVYSGFNEQMNEGGILLSDDLVTPPTTELLVGKLDEKIHTPILDMQDITTYQTNTDLMMQYSHDNFNTTFATNPAEHFLKIHAEMVKDRTKNQDVIMVGKNKDYKYEALKNIEQQLTKAGFERIIFYDADNKTQEELYNSSPGQPGKTYRVIYTQGMSHESMIACQALSGSLAGATGDQSLSESLSSNKIMVYECLKHKQTLIDDYDREIINSSNNDPEVTRTIELLRAAKNDADYEELGILLNTPQIQQKLIEANKAVIEKFDFVSQVMKDGLDWDPSQVAELLNKGDTKEALKLAIKGDVSIFATVEGKTLLQWAYNNEPNTFLQLLEKEKRYAVEQFLNCSDPDKGLEFLNNVKINPVSDTITGKTIFTRALEANRYDLAAKIYENAQTYKEKNVLFRTIHSKNSTGKTYLEQLKSEQPETEAHSILAKSGYSSVLTYLNENPPKPNTKESQAHHSFHELAEAFKNSSTGYNEKAFIGLLLVTKSKEPKHNFLSFQSNSLYRVCKNTLQNLGIDKNISSKQETEYYQELEKELIKNNNFISNKSINERKPNTVSVASITNNKAEANINITQQMKNSLQKAKQESDKRNDNEIPVSEHSSEPKSP